RQRPADHPGRRLHTGGTPLRRGDGPAGRRGTPQARAGKVPVSRTPTRLLGVDFGKVRIGLAVSDPDRKLAFPLEVHERRDRDADAAFFRALVEREEVGGLVVGLPVHLDGREGPEAAAARAFGAWLAAAT